NNKHVGCAGLRPYAGLLGDGEQVIEFGVHLKPDCWGSGLATEAGRRVVQHAFDTMQVQILFAGHHPENKASRNMLIKLGFLGTTAQFYEPTGLFHPSYLFYREAPLFKTRIADPSDARAVALVHCHSIRETFSGLLDDYVKARSLDHLEQAWERRFANNEC